MASRNEQLLEALLNGDTADIVPQSRNEQLLLALLNGETVDMVPRSRSEALLIALCEKGLSGGGSCDDVRYVTFMSEDGNVEYGKKAVAVGDDCADPIARGVFATPTRESDVQYNYTFYGWATEPNGGADANWNKAITEDKTVYANFSASVRYYTITYYDSNGTTVLKTESLAYGATPSYKPTKTDYMLGGWTPDVTEVTGDAAYIAIWVAKPLFAAASWAEIDEICQSGLAASAFNIGDKRTITIPYIKSNGTIYARYNIEFQIVGFDMETKEDGTKAAVTIASTYALSYGFFNNENNSIFEIKGKGWENCNVRASMNSIALPLWPSELQAVIKPVKKVSNAVASADSAKNVTTIDKLWIPSITEYGLSSAYTAPNQGSSYPRLNAIRQTPYINFNGSFITESGDYADHATRSDSTNTSYQMLVSSSGAAISTGAASGARICFCI